LTVRLTRSARSCRSLSVHGPGRSGTAALLVAEGEVEQGPDSRVEVVAIAELGTSFFVLALLHQGTGCIEESICRSAFFSVLGRNGSCHANDRQGSHPECEFSMTKQGEGEGGHCCSGCIKGERPVERGTRPALGFHLEQKPKE